MKLDYVNLGSGEVLRTTNKAALVRIEDEEEHWIPYSVIATETAAIAQEGAVIDRVRVEAWFADRNEIEVQR